MAVILSVTFVGIFVFCGVLSAEEAVIPEHYDTIVVGLGAAGTTAAATLAHAGRRVLALEAQGRVGGRVHTVSVGSGVVEVGGEWIHGTKSNRVYDLAIQNNIPLQAQSIDLVMKRPGGIPVNKALMNDIHERVFAVTDDMQGRSDSIADYLTQNLTNYIKEKYPKVFADDDFVYQLFKYIDLTVSLYHGSRSWTEVSAAHRFTELQGNQYMSWHNYGYKTYFEILLNKYNDGPGLPTLEIKLDTEVTQITWPQDPTERVSVECKDGTVYTANNVIVTVSLGVLKQRYTTLFSPALPRDKITAIENIDMGCLTKFILVFYNNWWADNSFGFLWTKFERGRLPPNAEWIQHVSGPTISMGNNHTLTFWSSLGIVSDTVPDDIFETKIMKLMRLFMSPSLSIPDPIEIIRSSWCTNPYTLGTYSFDGMKFNQHRNARSTLAQPLTDSAGKPRVLFAGEATDDIHYSTVHGASDTGYREAMRLLSVSNTTESTEQ